MGKHTPGPWKVSHKNTVVKGRDFVCQLWGKDEEDFSDNIDETEANAHLIAAAPEMLEALERIAGLWENSPEASQSQRSSLLYDARCIARKAIFCTTKVGQNG